MKVLVTGATGLVGSALVEALVGRMDRAVCLTRSGTRRRLLPGAGIDVVQGDPTRPGRWMDAAAGCDAVVNLAGESLAAGRWTARRKREFRRSRIESARNVAAAVAVSGSVRVLVNASAVGYYGDRGDEPLPEDHDSGADFLSRLAHEWEEACAGAEGSARVVKLRIGMVLARSGGALPRMAVPFRLGLGGPLGGGRQYVPWIHIDDLVRAILFILDTPAIEGPVNAVAPDPPTQRKFALTLGRVLHRPAVLPAPRFALRLLMGEMADLVLAGQRAVPKALRSHGFRFEHAYLETALSDLLD